MAIALMYNLPNIPKLVLDRQSLVDICAARITNWNDTRIASLNPSYSLPNASITLIYRPGGSGTNSVFTQALALFDPTFNYTNDPATWPVTLAGRGKVALESGDISVFVNNIPYTLGMHFVNNSLFFFSSNVRSSRRRFSHPMPLCAHTY